MPPSPPRGPTVAVIGGGPAGLMAAEVLATAGISVTVFERMPSVGRKLLLAGRGGLNLTHTDPPDHFLTAYGPAAEVMASPIRAFGPAELQRWSAGLGEPTFVGTSGRVFPVSLRATPLLRAWLRRLATVGVEIRTGHEWRGWDGSGALLFDHDGQDITYAADASILALGGASWPRTGSNGAWVDTMERAGVPVAPLQPANCGFRVTWTENFATKFAGTPLKNIAVTVAGRRVRGEAMVTRTGIEGGAIYALSRVLREQLDDDGRAVIEIDLRPDLSASEIADRYERRRTGDSATTALRRTVRLEPVAIGLMREATHNQLPTTSAHLATLVKAVPVELGGTQPIDRAISTAGGVALEAIDASFMLRSRPGTFVAGEMLDWEAPTGGYLLQGAFSTGVAAAEGVQRWLADIGHHLT